MTGEKYRQFKLLTWTTLIGQFFHPVGAHDCMVKDSSNSKSIYLPRLYDQFQA